MEERLIEDLSERIRADEGAGRMGSCATNHEREKSLHGISFGPITTASYDALKRGR